MIFIHPAHDNGYFAAPGLTEESIAANLATDPSDTNH